MTSSLKCGTRTRIRELSSSATPRRFPYNTGRANEIGLGESPFLFLMPKQILQVFVLEPMVSHLKLSQFLTLWRRHLPSLP